MRNTPLVYQLNRRKAKRNKKLCFTDLNWLKALKNVRYIIELSVPISLFFNSFPQISYFLGFYSDMAKQKRLPSYINGFCYSALPVKNLICVMKTNRI